MCLHEGSSWGRQGHEVGWFQQQLFPARILPQSSLLDKSEAVVSRTNSSLAITTARSTFVFSRARGSLDSWITPAGPIIADSSTRQSSLFASFWRPPTDNDTPKALPHWRSYRADMITSQLRSMMLKQDSPSDILVLTTTTYIAPPSLGWGWLATTTYQIQPDGSALSVFLELGKPTGATPQHLPRMGLDVKVDKSLECVKWFGRGPGESYPDKRSSQRVSVWEVDSVGALQTPYDVPQENGNHADTRWVEMFDKTMTMKLRVRRTQSRHPFDSAASSLEEDNRDQTMFNFTATKHSAQTIEHAAHPCDLVEDESTLLRLDAAVAGLGTGAWGPGIRKDHMVRPSEASFGFVLELR